MVTKLLSMVVLSLMVLGSFAVVDNADACSGGKRRLPSGRCG